MPDPDNVYKPPEADLSVQDPRLSILEGLFDAQNGLVAVIVAAIGAVLTAFLWSWVVGLYPLASPLFIGLSGVLIGIALRVMGKGLTPPFRVLAVAYHWLCVFLAFAVFQVHIVSPTPLVILMGLLVCGSIAAAVLSRRSLSTEEASVLWRASHAGELPRPRLRNSWWVMLTLGVLFAPLAVVLVLVMPAAI